MDINYANIMLRGKRKWSVEAKKCEGVRLEKKIIFNVGIEGVGKMIENALFYFM